MDPNFNYKSNLNSKNDTKKQLNVPKSFISGFVKKASDLLGLNTQIEKLDNEPNEIVYCKNNVCVHPKSPLHGNEVEHCPGYLSIRSQSDKVLGTTLILTWTPNMALEFNTRSLENSPLNLSSTVAKSSLSSKGRSPRLEFSTRSATVYNGSTGRNHHRRMTSMRHDSSNASVEMTGDHLTAIIDADSDTMTKSSSDELYDSPLVADTVYQTNFSQLLINDSRPVQQCHPGRIISVDSEHNLVALNEMKENDARSQSNINDIVSISVTSHLTHDNHVEHINNGIRDSLESSGSSTSGPDSSNEEEEIDDEIDEVFNFRKDIRKIESLNGSVFTVDLGKMKSLHLFSSNEAQTLLGGQLVIASKDCQYKVLHFHHSGLDKLNNDIFEHCKFLSPVSPKNCEQIFSKCRQYTVIRPYLGGAPTSMTFDIDDSSLTALESVSANTWRFHMNSFGRILDVYQLKKCIFYAGVMDDIRHELWPFLLNYYPYNSTFDQRQIIRNDRFIEYQNIRKKRDNMTESESISFWKDIQSIVENDVIRTDRSHPYFKGDHNPNVQVLKNILLNYGFSHREQGYTQGMSDLLSPILVAVENEIDAYWCFVGLMEKTVFITSPRDIDMDSQLLYLRELLRIYIPEFYELIESLVDGLELLFCHRWILLCFKREFTDTETLRIWESCWSANGTGHFHLFVVLAVISVYRPPRYESASGDDLLLHFSSLTMHMDVDIVLTKARYYLNLLRNSTSIPCTLYTLFVNESQHETDKNAVTLNHVTSAAWEGYVDPVTSPFDEKRVQCAGEPYCRNVSCPY